VSAPGIVIRVAFERLAPVVFSDAVNEGEQERLVAWLEQQPELAELVRRAVELEARAA
jgi:hypothetical protein